MLSCWRLSFSSLPLSKIRGHANVSWSLGFPLAYWLPGWSSGQYRTVLATRHSWYCANKWKLLCKRVYKWGWNKWAGSRLTCQNSYKPLFKILSRLWKHPIITTISRAKYIYPHKGNTTNPSLWPPTKMRCEKVFTDFPAQFPPRFGHVAIPKKAVCLGRREGTRSPCTLSLFRNVEEAMCQFQKCAQKEIIEVLQNFLSRLTWKRRLRARRQYYFYKIKN